MGNEWFDFLKTDFVTGWPRDCGFVVDAVRAGGFDTRLEVTPRHRQQDGFVHAGVLATMADHTAGYAGYTMVDKGFRILTVEFKINFFKPAVGPILWCRSAVIHKGRQLIVAESDLFSGNNTARKQVARAMVTLAAVSAGALDKDDSGVQTGIDGLARK